MNSIVVEGFRPATASHVSMASPTQHNSLSRMMAGSYRPCTLSAKFPGNSDCISKGCRPGLYIRAEASSAEEAVAFSSSSSSLEKNRLSIPTPGSLSSKLLLRLRSENVDDEDAKAVDATGSLFLLESEQASMKLDAAHAQAQIRIEKIVQQNIKGVDKIVMRMNETHRKLISVRSKVNHIEASSMPKPRKVCPEHEEREIMKRKLRKYTTVFEDIETERAVRTPSLLSSSAAEEEGGESDEGSSSSSSWALKSVLSKWFTAVAVSLALGNAAPVLPPPLGPAPAAAIDLSFGVTEGARDWLSEQKRRNSFFILAPIETARKRIQEASEIITITLGVGGPSESSANTAKDDDGDDATAQAAVARAQALVRAASLDCMPPAPGANSLTQMQLSAGLQPCTFKLIVKNAASLLPRDSPERLEADNRLSELIGSFVALDRQLLDSRGKKSVADEEQVLEAFAHTRTALDTFEDGIKIVLGLKA